jgi:hypothetical protein
MDVSLSEFDRIDGLCGGDNWDQLRRHFFSWSGSGLPPCFPPLRIGPLSVCIEAGQQFCLLWISHDRHQPTQVADERRVQAKLLTLLIWARQGDASRSHLSHDLAFVVRAQGKEGSYLAERGEILVLIGAQDRYDSSSLSLHTSQELSAHAFSIHNDPPELDVLFITLIARDDGLQSHHQMLIPTLCGSKQRVAVFIVEQD